MDEEYRVTLKVMKDQKQLILDKIKNSNNSKQNT